MKTLSRENFLAVLGLSLILAVAFLTGSTTPGMADSVGGAGMYLPFVARLYQGGLGSVTGNVTDALNGEILDGQIDEAQVCYQVTNCVFTTASGEYTFTGLPTGARWLTASAQGYHSFSTQVIIEADTTVEQNFPLAPDDLNPGQFRIIVSWDADPPDLDAHLYTSYLIGSKPHVFQGNRGVCEDPGQTEACLDIDATFGYGPETITIFEAPPADHGNVHFYYAVEKYEPCTPDCPSPLEASNAVVRVYGYTGLMRTYNVPTLNPGVKRFWSVFSLEFNKGEFIDIHDVDCLTDPPPTEDEPPTCPP